MQAFRITLQTQVILLLLLLLLSFFLGQGLFPSIFFLGHSMFKLSFHLLRGLPTFLLPIGDLSLAIFTIIFLSILIICLFHSCFRLYTHSFIFSTLHSLLIFSLLILSNTVFPDIFRRIFIFAVSNNLLVLDVSGLVSAVKIGLIVAL